VLRTSRIGSGVSRREDEDSEFAGLILETKEPHLHVLRPTAQAQTTLTTLFASNNGLSGNSMVFFDVTVKNPVRLTGFELNSYATVN
jgi:hypothetical protein